MKKDSSDLLFNGFFLVSIPIWLFIIDWNQLWSKTNLMALCGILAAILFLASNQYMKKNNKDKES